MKLVSLHQDFAYEMLAEALKSFIQLLYPIFFIEKYFQDKTVGLSMFWTSATDEGCEGSFGFCSTNRLVRREARFELKLYYKMCEMLKWEN
jgi:hypothetical protein